MNRGHSLILVPPIDQREQVVKHIHEAGHFGVEKVYKTLKQSFWWPAMHTHVVDVKRQCTDCAQVATPMNMPEPSQPIPALGKLHRWHVDLVGPLERTPSGNIYIIMAVDSATTKFAEAGAVSHKRAVIVKQWFYDNIICRYGCPVEVLTDYGLEFAGEFASTLKLLGINHWCAGATGKWCSGAAEWGCEESAGHSAKQCEVG